MSRRDVHVDCDSSARDVSVHDHSRAHPPAVPAQNSKSQESIGFLATQSYRHRHAHAFVRPRFTCAECCQHTLSTTTEAARISRSARIVRSRGPYIRPLQVPLSPSHRSVACTTATSVARPELFAATEPAPPSRRRVSSRSAIALRGYYGARTIAGGSDRRSGERSVRIVENRLPKSSSETRFLGRMGV